jgi:hypothetical protein
VRGGEDEAVHLCPRPIPLATVHHLRLQLAHSAHNLGPSLQPIAIGTLEHAVLAARTFDVIGRAVEGVPGEGGVS